MDYRAITRKLIKRLQAETEAAVQLAIKVGELENALASALATARASADEAYWAAEAAQDRAVARVRAAENDARETQQRAEDADYHRQVEIRRATDDLERSRTYGGIGSWAEQQALDKLKRLGRGY